MKALRIALAALLALVLLAGAGAGILLIEQEAVVRTVLRTVEERTGASISISTSRLRFASHLSVVLDDPRVTTAGGYAVPLKSIEAVFAYRSILLGRWLPLHSLTLVSPEITVPQGTADGNLPRPTAETVKRVMNLLRLLSGVTRRLETIDVAIRDARGGSLIDHLGIEAVCPYGEPDLWRFKFDAVPDQRRVRNLHVGGSFRIGSGADLEPGHVAEGRIWFWDLPLKALRTAALKATGTTQGNVDFSLRPDGTLGGKFDLGARRCVLRSKLLSEPARLSDFSLAGGFRLSMQAFEVTHAVLKARGSRVFEGGIGIDEIYGAHPKLRLSLQSPDLDVAALKARLLTVRELPAGLIGVLDAIVAGRLRVEQATFDSPLKSFGSLAPDAIHDHLRFAVTVSHLKIELPSNLKLPVLTETAGRINYSRGMLSLAQGSAVLGSSSIGDAHGRVEIDERLDEIPYQIAVKATADLDELNPAVVARLPGLSIGKRWRVKELGGRLGVSLNASGAVKRGGLNVPREYQVQLEPDHFRVALKDAPEPLEARAGRMTIDPRLVSFDRLEINGADGYATISGDLGLGPSPAKSSGATIEFHQMPAEKWLGLVLNPEDFSVHGEVGGRMVIRNDPGSAGRFTAEGRITLNRGTIKFSFLRSPIHARGATVTLKGDSAVLAMPDSLLEGSPLNFRMAVADLRRPVMRIDATVEKLDFEALNFVRMPWSPKVPSAPLKLPLQGRVTVRHGRLGPLVMSEIETDFVRDLKKWRVYDYTATSFGGRIKLEFSGKAADDVLRIKGSVANMNLGPIFLMSDTRAEPPLSGSLSTAFDLKAERGPDFFGTLSGEAAVTLRDGTVHRFTLLSRLLSLIDLRSWLSAKLPDPLVDGVPFDSIKGEFAGEEGVLRTDGLVLRGSVMDMSASGTLDLGRKTVDMQVGMFPFETVSWLMGKLPLVGKNAGGGTSNLLAAYFQVDGPISDPTITPKPITSVAEFVVKTLGLPINLIRPKTIQ